MSHYFAAKARSPLEKACGISLKAVPHCSNVRLNSAIGYITRKDMLAGRQRKIQAGRDRKLKAARQQRQSRRQQAA